MRGKRERKWTTIGPAAARLDITEGQLRTLIARGLVTTRALPGCPQEVLLADVERLVNAAVKPPEGAMLTGA